MTDRSPRRPLRVEVLLSVVKEFGEASFGLVAWELCLDEAQVLPAWDLAVAEQLLEPGRYDLAHDEQLVRLTRFGHQRLQVLDELSA